MADVVECQFEGRSNNPGCRSEQDCRLHCGLLAEEGQGQMDGLRVSRSTAIIRTQANGKFSQRIANVGWRTKREEETHGQADR